MIAPAIQLKPAVIAAPAIKPAAPAKPVEKKAAETKPGEKAPEKPAGRPPSRSRTERSGNRIDYMQPGASCSGLFAFLSPRQPRGG